MKIELADYCSPLHVKEGDSVSLIKENGELKTICKKCFKKWWEEKEDGKYSKN